MVVTPFQRERRRRSFRLIDPQAPSRKDVRKSTSDGQPTRRPTSSRASPQARRTNAPYILVHRQPVLDGRKGALLAVQLSHSRQVMPIGNRGLQVVQVDAVGVDEPPRVLHFAQPRPIEWRVCGVPWPR